ncbi:MAG: response regulator [Candidatus Thorarchaeota archaeon]
MSDKFSKSARGGDSTLHSSQREVFPKQSPSASVEAQLLHTNEVDNYRLKLSEVKPVPPRIPPPVAQFKFRVLRIEAGRPFQMLRYSPALTTTFEVVVVASGRKALTALQKDPFDAVHVSYSLPDMDGGEFLARLRNIAGPVPIVIFS